MTDTKPWNIRRTNNEFPLCEKLLPSLFDHVVDAQESMGPRIWMVHLGWIEKELAAYDALKAEADSLRLEVYHARCQTQASINEMETLKFDHVNETNSLRLSTEKLVEALKFYSKMDVTGYGPGDYMNAREALAEYHAALEGK